VARSIELANINPFTGPLLDNSMFDKSSMIGSNFNGVNLTDAFFFAVLKIARFNDCNLESVEFDDVNLSQSTFNNINLSGTSFSNINFSNVDISNANLTGMKINGILVTDLLKNYE
jgi:uncharacterized protein YjbI with pentapeptide repeats